MNRRELFRWTGAAALSVAAGRLYAVPAAHSKLLVVFLRGGYDAASLLVPFQSEYYYDVRPGIAIARPSDDPDSALPLDANWGLHPALRETVWPMYQRGEAAFVPFCGTHDVTRSHFETQDDVERGQAVGAPRADASGFLNRLLAEIGSARPLAFTDQIPIVMRGARPVPNMAVRSVSRSVISSRERELIGKLYAHTALATQVDESFALRDDVTRAVAGDVAARGAVSAGGFELEARRVGRLMVERCDIGFVDVGGWDTHVSQGAARGALAARLGGLGRGLAAIADAMGDRWRDTVVVVVSEFGRTFRENGNRGTDHGHGSVYWVLGGAVRGGRIAGEQVGLTRSTLFQDRDYPVLNEYRAVLAGLFARLYGLPASGVERVFPGVRAAGLDLV